MIFGALMAAPIGQLLSQAHGWRVGVGGFVIMALDVLKHPPFAVMSLAYFVCGMDQMLSAQALGVIGGFNVLGSLFFVGAGGRYNKLLLLGGIYVLCTFGSAWYFLSVPTP